MITFDIKPGSWQELQLLEAAKQLNIKPEVAQQTNAKVRTPISEEAEKTELDLTALLEEMNLFEKGSVSVGLFKIARIHTVMLSPGDKGFEHLQDNVFGIRNEHPIVEFLVSVLGIPDNVPYKIRTGFMKYKPASKMLFIARFKSDLPT